MSDFNSSFWDFYVTIITLVSIVACAVLLAAMSKRKVAGDPDKTAHVWDEDLGEYNNPLPRWWIWLFWITIVFSFLAVVAALLGLTIAVYNKALPWQSTDEVILEADRAGNQLVVPADVKLDGVLVGRVSGVSTDGDQVRMRLQLDKAQIDDIPDNVVARILPKTLFGEKFVELVIPGSPSAQALQAGDVISQDRSETATSRWSVRWSGRSASASLRWRRARSGRTPYAPQASSPGSSTPRARNPLSTRHGRSRAGTAVCGPSSSATPSEARQRLRWRF